MVQGIRIFVTLGVFALLLPGTQALALQARTSAVVEWPADCSGAERSWWDDMCMTWRNTLASKGWSTWWRNYEQVYIDRYVDASISSWGIDNNAINGFDGGEAALLCTHGGHGTTGWWALMHHKSHNDCRANVNQWKPGKASGGHLQYLHLSSCNSMRWDKVNTWFGPAAGGVHLVAGFHGIMYIGWYYVDDYEDQVEEAMAGESIADSWVNNMYSNPIIGPTVCPVVMAFGSTKTAALSRLFNERYNAQTGEMAGNYGVLEWIAGCDPDDAGPLPQ